MTPPNSPKKPRVRASKRSTPMEESDLKTYLNLDLGVQSVGTTGTPPPPTPPDLPNYSFDDNQPPRKGNNMDSQTRTGIIVAVIIACVILAFVACIELWASVPNGKYHIKQAAVSGEMTAYMRPGMYWKNFGDIKEWPVAETFYFTKDSEGGTEDASIEVRFNDGSICNISGTCRVDFPKTEQDAVSLSSKLGYRTYDQVEQKLLLPVIRRSLVMTANLMSAKESYSSRRSEFFQKAWDQIINGIYITKDEMAVEDDPITGAKINVTKKVILVSEKGEAQREKVNPLHDSGITLSNFEIKNFVYEDKVQKQIGAQQEAMMAVQTARANAQRAQQDALTIEAQGKADVMKAQYVEEQEKIKATVKANKEKEVAVIGATQLVEVAQKNKEQALVAAEQKKEVAALELDAAKLEKQKNIELGTGEAERKKLVMAADGALEKKLEAWVSAQTVWAAAFKDRKVPTTVMGGAGHGGDSDVTSFMQIMTAKALNDLSLDMTVTGGQVNRATEVPAPKK